PNAVTERRDEVREDRILITGEPKGAPRCAAAVVVRSEAARGRPLLGYLQPGVSPSQPVGVRARPVTCPVDSDRILRGLEAIGGQAQWPSRAVSAHQLRAHPVRPDWQVVDVVIARRVDGARERRDARAVDARSGRGEGELDAVAATAV